MKFEKLILTTLSLVVFSLSSLLAADFDWMINLNMRSDSDIHHYRSGLSSRFGVPESELNIILRSVRAPADAYMILRLCELSSRPPEYVLRQYHYKKNQGWGTLAQSLGIKPGSRGFQELRRGHDLKDRYDDNFRDNRQDRDRDHGNKGNGKR